MPLIADAQSWHYVRPHITKDGTYVQGHQQTNPDGNRFNNWSTQGNYNPYTGQAGTVNPYSQPAPQPRQGYVNPYSSHQCGYNSRGQYVCR
ncbi:hypothetical protein JJB11_12275 [Ramlibacter ginsenosidimutans]|uniref:Uncharacterized protein n=1 Tax=Ramlibacter ginsenosidimutans TaxID=502333 RepID=A0A934TT31_9BURK|nr:hypothetical protein [Ramlibacter ginsenosidimutans]MBK6006868.1 hypothetical protein [Ramlibacter ginsenosidimutans]